MAKDRARILFYMAHNTVKIEQFDGIPLNIDKTFFKKISEESKTDVNGIVARYITIFSPINTALHLSSIKIFGELGD
jgi:hypothetical protein